MAKKQPEYEFDPVLMRQAEGVVAGRSDVRDKSKPKRRRKKKRAK